MALWMAVAVVALSGTIRPTPLAGLAYGVGVVLLVDGVRRWWSPAGGRLPVGPSPVPATASDAPGAAPEPGA